MWANGDGYLSRDIGMTGPSPENGPLPEQNTKGGGVNGAPYDADRGAGVPGCGPHSSLLDLGAWLMLRAPFSAGVTHAA